MALAFTLGKALSFPGHESMNPLNSETTPSSFPVIHPSTHPPVRLSVAVKFRLLRFCPIRCTRTLTRTRAHIHTRTPTHTHTATNSVGENSHPNYILGRCFWQVTQHLQILSFSFRKTKMITVVSGADQVKPQPPSTLCTADNVLCPAWNTTSISPPLNIYVMDGKLFPKSADAINRIFFFTVNLLIRPFLSILS